MSVTVTKEANCYRALDMKGLQSVEQADKERHTVQSCSLPVFWTALCVPGTVPGLRQGSPSALAGLEVKPLCALHPASLGRRCCPNCPLSHSTAEGTFPGRLTRTHMHTFRHTPAHTHASTRSSTNFLFNAAGWGRSA